MNGKVRDSVPWEPVPGHDTTTVRRDWSKCICGSWPADGMHLKDCVVHDPAKGGLPPQDVFDD